MGDTSLRLAGLAMDPSPWLVVPLCPFCVLILVTELPLVGIVVVVVCVQTDENVKRERTTEKKFVLQQFCLFRFGI